MRPALVLIAAIIAALVPGGIAAAEEETPSPVVPYIIGGTDAPPDAWPSMVALVEQTPTGLFQRCAGTLIRRDLVLTAAHCTEQYLDDPAKLLVLLGRSDLQTTSGELVATSAIIQHPDWNGSTFRGDLSLIRLSQPSPRQVAPFANARTEPIWASSPSATVIGWGRTGTDGATSPRLQQVDVDVLDDVTCNLGISTYHAGMDLCAGGVDFGPCNGDSGGGLYAPSGGAMTVSGVVSRGLEKCGTGPAIFTRVAAYADWIYQQTTSERTTRTAGADRYATSATLSARFAAGVPVAYLVTGEQFPDAVSAAAVAGRSGGPVLLTTRDSLPDVTRTELMRLQPQRLVVVGGARAVSDQVAAQASVAAGVTAVRISGADRYGTAAALADEAFPTGAATVFVAVGTSFPDAVSSGPVAGGAAGGPVLLTETTRLPEATSSQLGRLMPTRVVILGGTSAVGTGVQSQIQSLLPAAQIERISGPDRFATSAALSAATFVPGIDVVYLATGGAFPDALASGPVAVLDGAPVLLIDGSRISASVVDEIRRLAPSRLMILGGTSAISLHTGWLLDGLL